MRSFLFVGFVLVCLNLFATENESRFIIKFKDGLQKSNEQLFSEINKNIGGEIIKNINTESRRDLLVIKLNGKNNIEEKIEKLKDSGLIEFIEPDYVGSGGGQQSTIPNDTHFNKQWSLINNGAKVGTIQGKADADIDIDEAWEIEKGDTNIIVAVLDSGLKLDHPDIKNRVWKNNKEILNGIDDDNNGYIDDINGWDFTNRDNDPTDDHGHGTNVASIIGAESNNNLGFSGVDWNCKIMICKILNSSNTGFYSDWTDAIYYAVRNGAKVINMSVGGTGFSSSMEQAVNFAKDNGVIVVSIMMNNNNEITNYPGGYTNTIAVGSTNPDDTRTESFFWGGGSNYGSHIDLVAPGNYIYGLNANSNTSYSSYWGGTSQAGPHVAGVVSLLLAQDNSRTFDEIKNILISTAEDQVGNKEDTQGWDKYYGYGRLNANAALRYSITSVENNKELPTEMNLYQNYPNPFNPSTRIKFDVLKAQKVTLNIYDILGNKIETLVNKELPSGIHEYNFSGKNYSSGVYFYKLIFGNNSISKKMVILK